jgi:hypothetical protein
LDRAYDDKLSGKIDEEFWTRKSRQWQSELKEIRLSMARYENATKKNYELGITILELAKKAHQLYLQQDHHERRKLAQYPIIELRLRARKSLSDIPQALRHPGTERQIRELASPTGFEPVLPH